jgi:hypothetical protein
MYIFWVLREVNLLAKFNVQRITGWSFVSLYIRFLYNSLSLRPASTLFFFKLIFIRLLKLYITSATRLVKQLQPHTCIFCALNQILVLKMAFGVIGERMGSLQDDSCKVGLKRGLRCMGLVTACWIFGNSLCFIITEVNFCSYFLLFFDLTFIL